MSGLFFGCKVLRIDAQEKLSLKSMFNIFEQIYFDKEGLIRTVSIRSYIDFCICRPKDEDNESSIRSSSVVFDSCGSSIFLLL